MVQTVLLACRHGRDWRNGRQDGCAVKRGRKTPSSHPLLGSLHASLCDIFIVYCASTYNAYADGCFGQYATSDLSCLEDTHTHKFSKGQSKWQSAFAHHTEHRENIYSTNMNYELCFFHENDKGIPKLRKVCFEVNLRNATSLKQLHFTYKQRDFTK